MATEDMAAGDGRKDLRSEARRLNTFRNWPSDAPVRQRDLALNGFYYTGEGDSVRCFHCNWRFHRWRAGDDPAAEHAVQNPECQFHQQYRDDPTVCGNIPLDSIQEDPHWNGERQRMTAEGDRLNHHTYATRLVEMLSDRATTTPLTVGLFANWGQGKSSVLELSEQCIEKHNQDNKAAEVSWYSHMCYCPASCCRCGAGGTRRAHGKTGVRWLFLLQLVVVSIILALITVAVVLGIVFLWTDPAVRTNAVNVTHYTAERNSTLTLTTASPTEKSPQFTERTKRWVVGVCLVPIAFILVAFLVFLCATREPNSCCRFPLKWIITCFYYPDFQQEEEEDKDDDRPVEMILVKFNAWEYAGCDIIWAGIIKNLFDGLLEYFGSSNCRLYRIIREDYNAMFKEYDDQRQNHRRNSEIQSRTNQNQGSGHAASSLPQTAGSASNAASGTASIDRVPSPVATPQPTEQMSPAGNTIEMQPTGTVGTDSVSTTLLPDGGGNEQPGTETNSNRHDPESAVTVIPYSICGIPKHVCYAGFTLLSLGSAIVFVLLVALGVLQTASIAVSAFLVGLPLMALVGTIIKGLTQGYKFFQEDMLTKAFLDEDIKKGLGVMHKIKREVQTLTGMIRYMGWQQQKRFRVVICVDDLDRCEKTRVMQVLEAVSIILSEHGAPFISVFAIDPRIIVSAIESTMEADITDFHEVASLNGYDYLKKIIHLPFWLPMANEAYISRLLGALRTREPAAPTQATPAIQADSQTSQTSGAPAEAAEDEPDAPSSESVMQPYEAAMEEIQRYPWILSKNPRSVKRIANVLNLAVRLWCQEVDPRSRPLIDEQQLALFIVLAEQWPYRLSLLAQIASDSDKDEPYKNKPADDDSLLDVYHANSHLLCLPKESWKKLIDFDQTRGCFEEVLKLTKATLRHLGLSLRFIINLDGALRETISLAVIKHRLEAKWASVQQNSVSLARDGGQSPETNMGDA